MPLQSYLNRLCSSNQSPHYVLLAGAVTASDPAIAEKTVVPTVRGSVGRMKGKLSDYGYGLPEKDGKPTVAIGRFPARTVAEVRAMVQKTLEFEQDRQPGAWHNRLTMLAGNPGGGPLAEMFVEQVMAPRLARLHLSWNLRALVHSTSSRYYAHALQQLSRDLSRRCTEVASMSASARYAELSSYFNQRLARNAICEARTLEQKVIQSRLGAWNR